LHDRKRRRGRTPAADTEPFDLYTDDLYTESFERADFTHDVAQHLAY
jgi:hypothetical protein